MIEDYGHIIDYVKETVSRRILKQSAFEPNDKITRKDLKKVVKVFLKKFSKIEPDIIEYKVVCDETINTPETIDRHELHMNVFLKFPYDEKDDPIERRSFIQLSIVISGTEVLIMEILC